MRHLCGRSQVSFTVGLFLESGLAGLGLLHAGVGLFAVWRGKKTGVLPRDGDGLSPLAIASRIVLAAIAFGAT